MKIIDPNITVRIPDWILILAISIPIILKLMKWPEKKHKKLIRERLVKRKRKVLEKMLKIRTED